MQKIVTAIVKGGSGKTSTALAIAQAAAHAGRRVLAIDLDPQANFSYSLCADMGQPGAADMLHGATAADVIQQTPQGIDTITGSAALMTEETAKGSIRRLANFLAPLERRYDVCVMDTPTTVGETTYNALAAGTDLIIPMHAAPFDIVGLIHVINLCSMMTEAGVYGIRRRGIVLTEYNDRAKIDQHTREEIEEMAAQNHIPILGTIRRGVAIPESQAWRRSLYDHAPRSNPAIDYMAIYTRIITGKNKKSY